MKFNFVEVIVNKGGGAVGLQFKIIDSESTGGEEYTSTDFDRDKGQYVRKNAEGRWIGLSLDSEDAANAMVTCLNMGWEARYKEFS